MAEETCSVQYDECCVFCEIVKGNDPDTKILVDDKDIICFKDICPGAPHHYLVIPKKHIYSCLSLQADDINLVRRMAKIGRDVLMDHNFRNEDMSLGFHVPPNITVPHLHLHVLAPVNQLYIQTRFKYTSHWYLTVDKVLNTLGKKGDSSKTLKCLKHVFQCSRF